MPTDHATLIVQMPLFSGLTVNGAQRLLSSGVVEEHQLGEELCKEGDAADSVLLILTGTLRAYIEREGAELVLADFGPGTILGDVAALCGIPRAVSVRTLEPCAVLSWTTKAYRRLLFDDVFLSHRIFGATMRMLIENEKALLESLVAGSTR